MTGEPIDFDLYHPEPLLIVISGPSGVGKDAVIILMKERNLPFKFVITMTTRPKRETEQEGVDYFFVTHQQFEEMIARGLLIEHARVYNDYKGIPKSQIEEAIASGKDVIMRLDVQGAARIRTLYPEAVLIFLIPSSHEEWLQRLIRRGEPPKDLELRIKTAREEVTRISEFDYVVVNSEGQLEKAVDTIKSIITSEHHRINHRKVVL